MGKVHIILTDSSAEHQRLKHFQFDILCFKKTTFYTKKLLYYSSILRRITEIIQYVASREVASLKEIELAGFLPEEIRDYLARPEFFELKKRRLARMVNLANLLILDYCKEFEADFQRSERSIEPLITAFDHHIGSDQPEVSAFPSTTPDHIVYAYTQVKLLVRKLYRRRFRDVRGRLRIILRFFSMHRDDEDPVKNVAVVTQCYKASFFHANPSLWKRKKFSIS